MKSLSLGRTPGADGIQPEVYRTFWDPLSNPLMNCFNYSHQIKKLCLSTRKGIISLIPKKDRDQLYIKNWRPLTLLNTDFKILAKVLALRIKPHLDMIIHPSQTGFMANRNIAHKIRKIIDIIEYTEKMISKW